LNEDTRPTIGSLFAGIGGFDLGFERAGWRTAWQVELTDINRAVLADRFPAAARFADVRHCGAKNLSRVACITAGFPCQDISTSGYSRADKSRQGLKGERSGLFHEVIRIVREIQPAWVVLENVPALLHSNDCEDIQTVIKSLADCGYMGCFRVLDARYFGVAQGRRRIFLVAGLGKLPSLDLLADAAPMEAIPRPLPAVGESRAGDAQAAYTLQHENSNGHRFCLGGELFIAEPGGWPAMLERERKTRAARFCLGLDAANFAEAASAGNAVCPAIAEWIARILLKS